METTNAILLRKRKLIDTSLIDSGFIESLGCTETVAKGARRDASLQTRSKARLRRNDPD
jgi:hypothetical protein